MNLLRGLITGMLFIWATAGAADARYLARFHTYLTYLDHPPKIADTAFIQFINQDAPLSTKIRERWLYQLGRAQNWQDYQQFYRFSADKNLRCFNELAHYYLGQHQHLVEQTRPLWLSGHPLPSVCHALGELMIDKGFFKESLIIERVILALEKNNVKLAQTLLKRHLSHLDYNAALLHLITQKPHHIITLNTPHRLQSVFYLYGLKQLLKNNPKDALKFWQFPETKKRLSLGQQQVFIRAVALQKARRGEPEALKWFNQLNPAYYNRTLIDWQIRLALRKLDWPMVKKLILSFYDKHDLYQQYWLARAEQAMHHPDKAKAIYQALALNRNYYGFLASMRLNQPFHFEYESSIDNAELLKPYHSFLDEIKELHHQHHDTKAIRLINDFVLELPKAETQALIYWLAFDLKWPARALYLSNRQEFADQLALRFPLAYQSQVLHLAKRHHLPTALIYAVIRQESHFKESVTSKAGAQGLMQLLPSTAKQMARLEHLRLPLDLFDPATNLRLGSAYLAYLTKQLKHPILVLAAYNAGPGQVQRWRSKDGVSTADIWVELVPWRETRNYLKNLVAFYAVYEYRMAHQPNINPFFTPLS
ncbi:MAG: lytic murein transglycosylase [Legionellaceae bacterium]|nr:lytic murein transglycosylase [Legionellaceae bacterium]HCA88750.1 lytic murein transglycosylase [Legionellales bacterium]|tara:strand:- start:2196 stop:3974 length:1779 start_codon:yes stop_codon:yes gene_type:complete